MSGYLLILALGGMIVLGHIFGKIADKFKMPEVTGFIVAGILINLVFRFGFDMESELHKMVDSFQVIITIALSFVSFIIGTKLWAVKVKSISKTVFAVVGLQFIFVVGFTTLGFWFFKDIKYGLLIGAISAATAPAPIIEITNKYSTRGPLTETLKSIVGFDNLFGIMYFFIIAAIVPQIGESSFSFAPILNSLLGITISIALGAILGLALVLFDKRAFYKYKGHEKYDSYLIVSVGIVILTALGAHVLDHQVLHMPISPFIATLVLGIVFTNLTDRDTYEYETNVIGKFTPPLITAFFVIAGMELDVLLLITPVGLLALLYVVTHVSGKYLGAHMGTRLVHDTNLKVKKHLPLASLTQGGFEIALAMIASTIIDDPKILSVVLTSVLMFEFFAPLLLTKQLHKAGEVSFVAIDSE